MLYEKVDAAGNSLRLKEIGGTPAFDSRGDKGRWLTVNQQSRPIYDQATQRLERTRTIRQTEVVYGYRVANLTADEQRDRVDPAEDLAETLIGKGLIVRTDLRSRLGR